MLVTYLSPYDEPRKRNIFHDVGSPLDTGIR